MQMMSSENVSAEQNHRAGGGSEAGFFRPCSKKSHCKNGRFWYNKFESNIFYGIATYLGMEEFYENFRCINRNKERQ